MRGALAFDRLFEYYASRYSLWQVPVSSEPPSLPTPQEMAAFIRSAWENQDISQKEVARDLGIHQSQFSKLVNGRFKEADGHAARLFEYSKQRQGAGGRARSPAVAETIRASLTERLMQAWDGTAEGARALEAILDGAARLRQARLRGR